ncbi:hypothetical protein GF319_08295 [Candidatus Bathyarchaeota archaeon]|nr:hypothetical protein [Candidatus Bathyarchaeota archaeon]
MDLIDTFLGSAMALLSGVVIVLWTRVTVKVSQMDAISKSPNQVQDIGLQTIGNTD